MLETSVAPVAVSLAVLLVSACGSSRDCESGSVERDAGCIAAGDGDADADGGVCESTCSVRDDTRCNGGAIELCTQSVPHTARPCLVWVEIQDCAANESCDDGREGPALCVCDPCPVPGDTQCSGDVLETCTQGVDGCVGWEEIQDCAAQGLWCADATGSATCARDVCQADDTQCNGDVVETCTAGIDGWLRWEQSADCSGSAIGCRGGVCIACEGDAWDGDYTISDAASLEILIGYACVTGALEVAGAELVSLDGLEGLQAVGGDVTISANPALTSLAGLSGLTAVGRDFGISENDALADLDGLSALTLIGGALRIGRVDSVIKGPSVLVGNATLTNLDGLSGLTSLGASALDRWPVSLEIIANEALENVDGLSGVTSVEGDVTISGNDALTNLNGLGALTSVGGNLLIGAMFSAYGTGGSWSDGNGVLTSLDGLAVLTDLAGNLTVADNTVLPTCEATALADRLLSLGWDGESLVMGNDDAGVCE